MIDTDDFTIRFASYLGAGPIGSANFRSDWMTFSYRRKPLARIILLGFAGLMAGGNAVDAWAQAPAPLRVDPALLGLPAIKPEEKVVPAPAEKKSPA